jgi:hypothetical protein
MYSFQIFTMRILSKWHHTISLLANTVYEPGSRGSAGLKITRDRTHPFPQGKSEFRRHSRPLRADGVGRRDTKQKSPVTDTSLSFVPTSVPSTVHKRDNSGNAFAFPTAGGDVV